MHSKILLIKHLCHETISSSLTDIQRMQVVVNQPNDDLRSCQFTA